MPRTTAEAVRGIYLSIPADVDLDPFITVADAIVTVRLTALGYSDDTLATIALLLTCHLYEVDNPRIMQEGQGNQYATERLESRVDLGLNLTRWGQQLSMLDPLGGLLRKQKKSITWIGEPFIGADYRRGRV